MRRLVVAGALLAASVAAASAAPVARAADVAPALLACWTPPPGSEGLEITLVFGFRRDGTLLGPPRISHARLGRDRDLGKRFVASALAALANCTPLSLAPSLGRVIAGRPFAMLFRAVPRATRA